MSPAAVTDGDWEASVLRAPGPVLVDFWAPWCVPCRAVSALAADLAERHAGRLTVLTVNTDDEPRLAGRYDILSVPTLILFSGGAPVERLGGNIRAKRLDAALAPNLDQE